jgi:hypothetical protein
MTALVDLTADSIACHLLYEVGRRPLDETNWHVLCDRVEELGFAGVSDFRASFMAHWMGRVGAARSRRERQRRIRGLRTALVTAFGDYRQKVRYEDEPSMGEVELPF